jgi:ribosomal protein S18 acetylase RimI-like enzyme
VSWCATTIVAATRSERPYVRVLGPDDDEDLWVLRGRALRESPDAFAVHPDEHPLLPAFRRRQAERHADPGNRTLGAFLQGRLVGMAVVVREDLIKTRHRANLYGVYVAPEVRRAGVGRALLDAAVAAATELGAELLELGVSALNAPAIALYERAGFRRWGVQPRALRLDDHDLDEIWMTLVLAAPERTPPPAPPG